MHRTLEGRRVDNASLKGEVVVLNFWFTTCGPCIGEMTELNGLVRDFGDRVRFLAFTHEPPEMVRMFLGNHEFDYEIVPNARETEKSFGIGSHPTHVLLDREGKVRWQGLGANPDNLKRLRATIQRALTIGDTHVVRP
ncbi:MAG: TlpA disulfide reductase family protein [Acidobacteriota bacterium]